MVWVCFGFILWNLAVQDTIQIYEKGDEGLEYRDKDKIKNNEDYEIIEIKVVDEQRDSKNRKIKSKANQKI